MKNSDQHCSHAQETNKEWCEGGKYRGEAPVNLG